MIIDDGLVVVVVVLEPVVIIIVKSMFSGKFGRIFFTHFRCGTFFLFLNL